MRISAWGLALGVAALGCDSDDGTTSSDDTAASASASGTDAESEEGSEAEADSANGEESGDEAGEATSQGGEETSGSTTDDACAVSHELDLQPIWDEHCVAACHEAGGTWSAFKLSSIDSYRAMVDVDSSQTLTNSELKVVVPGDIESSYLIHKLRGTQASVIDPSLAGLGMPAVDPPGGATEAGPPLEEATIQLVETWIDCGAPE